jgi:hypothetical protein
MRAVVFLFFSAVTAAAWPEASTVSVCDIMHQGPESTKPVRVMSRMLFTRHGVFLTTDSCVDHSFDIVLLYPGIEGTPPVPFSLDLESMRLLGPFLRPTGGTAAGCAVLDGRVVYKKGFRAKERGAGPQGNGFGPRGAFRVAFVLQSVKEIHDCK